MGYLPRLLPLAVIPLSIGCGGGGGAGNGTGEHAFYASSSPETYAIQTSHDGVYAAGRTVSGGVTTPTLWRGTAVAQTFPPAGGGSYVLNAVTDDGTVFSGFSTDGGVTSIPRVYTVAAGWTDLARPNGVASATIAGVSEDGTTVLADTGTSLYLVNGGVATPLPDSSPTAPSRAALSGNGSVVYQASSLGITRRVGTGAPTVVINPTASPTLAGVAYTGTVIAGTITVAGSSDTRAFRYVASSDTFSDLGVLGNDASSVAVGIDRTGSTIVGTSISSGGAIRPFLWTSTRGIRALEDYASGAFDGLTKVRPTAISSDGRTIVGYGTESAGTAGERVRAWVIRR